MKKKYKKIFKIFSLSSIGASSTVLVAQSCSNIPSAPPEILNDLSIIFANLNHNNLNVNTSPETEVILDSFLDVINASTSLQSIDENFDEILAMNNLSVQSITDEGGGAFRISLPTTVTIEVRNSKISASQTTIKLQNTTINFFLVVRTSNDSEINFSTVSLPNNDFEYVFDRDYSNSQINSLFTSTILETINATSPTKGSLLRSSANDNANFNLLETEINGNYNFLSVRGFVHKLNSLLLSPNSTFTNVIFAPLEGGEYGISLT